MLVQAYDNEKVQNHESPTFLRAIGPEPWNAAYVEPSSSADGRYRKTQTVFTNTTNSKWSWNHHHQTSKELYLESLEKLGINPLEHDTRLVEDN